MSLSNPGSSGLPVKAVGCRASRTQLFGWEGKVTKGKQEHQNSTWYTGQVKISI